MKVKIDDFILTMGTICGEHENCSHSKCLFFINTDTFCGCVKDNLLLPECRKVLKREALKRIKENRK